MHRYAIFLLLALLLVGCTPAPHALKVVEYPAITTLATSAPFEAAGCTPVTGFNGNRLTCAEDALTTLGCGEILVDPLLGALTAKPIAFCGTMRDGGPIQFFEKSGLVIDEADGQFRFIPRGAENYQREFAPIENAAQAVAYAQLVGGGSVVNDFPADMTTDVAGLTEVHETHADATSDGFVVNLFHDDQGSNVNDPKCRASQYEVLVTVARDGTVTKAEPRRIRDTGPCVIY